MILRDFTYDDYERLLDCALAAKYEFLTVADYLRREPSSLPRRVVIMRHDVDRRPRNAYVMGGLEADRDIAATYYFRTSTFDGGDVRTLHDQGHEIGYHYEDLAKVDGDVTAAHRRFKRNLDEFRASVPINTICPHGSPLSPHQNLDMWDDGPRIESYNLLGDAVRSIDTGSTDTAEFVYVSDTGRSWGDKISRVGHVETTDEVIALLESGRFDRVYFLAHPCRWAGTALELAHRIAWDVGAETAKYIAKTLQRATAARRTAGPRYPGRIRTR